MNPNNITPQASLITILVLLSSGCQTTPSVQNPTISKQSKIAPEPIEIKESITIEKGSPVELLVEKLGEPVEKHPMKKYPELGTIWVYHRKLGSTMRMVSTGIQRVAPAGPEAKRDLLVLSDVQTPEIITIIEITEFLIMEGRVVSWKQRQLTERNLMD